MIKFDPKILENLYQPPIASHKGQNGKVLVIGGSKLFHASIYWSADMASRLVDMVLFTSPANENNDLVRYRLKQGFWRGVVVDFLEVERYLQEVDVILIGPGMSRQEGLLPGERPTGEIVNELLGKYPEKKWVIDGGALQEVDPNLIAGSCILTPHLGEWERLLSKHHSSISVNQTKNNEELLVGFSQSHQGCAILLKGQVDLVCKGEKVVEVEGGNAGMTKGGTGDVLAGMVAGLYAKNDAMLAAMAASYLVKQGGDRLLAQKGYWYVAGELIEAVGA